MNYFATLVIFLLTLLFSAVRAVPPTLMNIRDTDDIESIEPEQNKIAPIFSHPSTPSYSEFVSNDGMTLRIATKTLLDKDLGPLDSKIRNRNSMQTTTFVDVPSSLLDAMLNFYRYGVLKCPPKEKVDPAICQRAFDEHLPGVEQIGDEPPEDEIQEGEIIIHIFRERFVRNNPKIRISYPKIHHEWIIQLLNIVWPVSNNPWPWSLNRDDKMWELTRITPYHHDEVSTAYEMLVLSIQKDLIFNAPSNLKVSTHLATEKLTILRIEKRSKK